MKLDVYSYISEEVKSDDNTTTEKSTRKSFKNLTLEEAKERVDELFKNFPENANNVYIEIHKSYEERMEDALNSI